MKNTNKKPTSRHSLLIIEDSKAITQALCAFLCDELSIPVETAKDFDTAQRLLDSKPHRFFMAIVDLHLPDATPEQVVDYVIGQGVPPLILTANFCPETKHQMLEKAVIDYVIKRDMSELWYVACVVERVMTNAERKILIVDDSAPCRLVLSTHLKRQRLPVLEAKDGAEALEILKANPDILIVITDQNMPGMLGTELVIKIRSQFSRKKMGIIGMSSMEDRKVIAQLLKSGANDFFLKPYSYEELFCRIAQNIDALVSHQKLSDASIRDPLTGVYSRKYLQDISGMICSQATQTQSLLITMLVEIHDLDELVILYGSKFYEDALIHLTRTLLRCTRETDVIARLENEDLFCVVMCLDANDDSEKTIFSRIEKELNNNPMYPRVNPTNISVRIGHFSTREPNFENCMAKARESLLLQSGESSK